MSAEPRSDADRDDLDLGDPDLGRALGRLAPPASRADEVLSGLRPRYARARARRTGVRLASLAAASVALVATATVVSNGEPEVDLVASGGAAPVEVTTSLTDASDAPGVQEEDAPVTTLPTTSTGRPSTSAGPPTSPAPTAEQQPPADAPPATAQVGRDATAEPEPAGAGDPTGRPVEAPAREEGGSGRDDGRDADESDDDDGADDDRHEPDRADVAGDDSSERPGDGESDRDGGGRWTVRVSGVELTVEVGADGSLEVVDVDSDDVVVTDGPGRTIRVRVHGKELVLGADAESVTCRSASGDSRLGACVVTPR